MALTWAASEDFLRREAERDHGRGCLPRPVLIAFRGEEALLLGFCRQLRRGEPGLGVALLELAQFAQLVSPDALLCTMGATLRPMTVQPLVGHTTGGRSLVVQTAARKGSRVEEATRLLPYGLGDDGTLRWGEPVSFPQAVPSPARRTLRAALLAGRARPDLDLGEVAAMLVGWGHLIALAPSVVGDHVSRVHPRG